MTMRKLLLLLIVTSPLAAESIPAQQVMTPEEKKNIGYDKLSSEEKRAFDQWVATWTLHVLEQSSSYRPGQNLSSWIQSWPSHANPTKTELTQDEINQRIQSNQMVDRVRTNGEFIDLRDGSTWHISPFFRYLTQNWQKGQTIEVQPGTNQMHPWLLHNISRGEVAEADMVSGPSPTGKRPDESPEHYVGAIAVQSTTPQGDLLSLADGTQWKVAPTDQFKVKNWNPADRIRVEPSENFLYKYKFTNLDTGETALGNPRK